MPCPYNPHQPLCLCCDFNVDPMCWCLAQDYGRKVFVLDEIGLRNSNTQEACQVSVDRMRPYLTEFRQFYGRPLDVKIYA